MPREKALYKPQSEDTSKPFLSNPFWKTEARMTPETEKILYWTVGSTFEELTCFPSLVSRDVVFMKAGWFLSFLLRSEAITASLKYSGQTWKDAIWIKEFHVCHQNGLLFFPPKTWEHMWIQFLEKFCNILLWQLQSMFCVELKGRPVQMLLSAKSSIQSEWGVETSPPFGLLILSNNLLFIKPVFWYSDAEIHQLILDTFHEN